MAEDFEFDPYETSVRLEVAGEAAKARKPDGSELTMGEKRVLEDMATDIIREVFELAHAGGRVLGEFAVEDPESGLELLGGEAETRIKIGDEATDYLLAEIKKRQGGE